MAVLLLFQSDSQINLSILMLNEHKQNASNVTICTISNIYNIYICYGFGFFCSTLNPFDLMVMMMKEPHCWLNKQM